MSGFDSQGDFFINIKPLEPFEIINNNKFSLNV